MHLHPGGPFSNLTAPHLLQATCMDHCGTSNLSVSLERADKRVFTATVELWNWRLGSGRISISSPRLQHIKMFCKPSSLPASQGASSQIKAVVRITRLLWLPKSFGRGVDRQNKCNDSDL